MNRSLHNQQHWQEVGIGYKNVWDKKSREHMNLQELKFISNYLKQTEATNVLDVGVGTGRIIDSYIQGGHTKNIYGIDVAPTMVNYCLNKYKGTESIKNIITHDISKDDLPFKVKFDFISAIRVLKYNKNWEEIVSKLANHLNNNGVFVFTMPNRNSLTRFSKYPIPIYQTTYHKIEELCKSLNLEILEITSFTKMPDILYEATENSTYISFLTSVESALKHVFGGPLLGRIFFITVRKRV